MAICNVKKRCELGEGLVLAPERYDPRREMLSSTKAACSLADVAECLQRTVSPSSGRSSAGRYLVVNTSDAHEGVLVVNREPVAVTEIGSTKKVVEPGCVLVSRLRPYLRQVALADRGIREWQGDVELVCSTEFYVLRARDERSIAFLVPLLLSEQVQAVLAAAQEGGHHPRFNESTLLGLPIPRTVLERREQMSAAVERGLACFRAGADIMSGQVSLAQDGFAGGE
jgi:hypothetical protein